MGGDTHCKAVLFLLWHFWWVRVPRPSQVTGVTFLMRQTFLCVQAVWLFLSKMWIWSTIGLLLIVWHEKEGDSREILQCWGVGWTPPPLAAQPALAFCWTVWAHLASRGKGPEGTEKGQGFVLCVKFRFEWWSRKFRLCMKWLYSKSWNWCYWLTFA